jgi:ribosomal protein S27AE
LTTPSELIAELDEEMLVALVMKLTGGSANPAVVRAQIRRIRQEAFTCPLCGAVSYNSNDVRERYCGRCHRFVDDAYEQGHRARNHPAHPHPR